jgi:uncharacterized protein
MRFTEDSAPGVNLIRGYAAGELRVNDQRIRGGVILSASTIALEPALKSIADLTQEHAASVFALQPELVLLGTGERQTFPPAAFGAEFLRRGIGFEVMNTGAACRTFNVLVAEQRRVVAVLLG